MKNLSFLFKSSCIFLVAILFGCAEEEISRNAAPTTVDDELSAQPFDEFSQLSNCSGDRSVYYFHRGNGSAGLFYGGKDTGTSWPDYCEVPGSEATEFGPEVVFFQNKLFAFYKGNSNSYIYYKTSTDGENWSSESQVGGSGIVTSIQFDAVVYNNKIYVFFQKNGSNEIRVVSTQNGTSWDLGSSQGYLTYSMSPDSATALAATVYDGEIVLSYTEAPDGIFSSSGRIWVSSDSDPTGFTTWYDTDEHASSAPELATYNNTLYLVFAGKNTSNLTYLWTEEVLNASSWSETWWIYVNGILAKTDGPSIIDDGSRLLIVYKGNSNRNLYQAYTTTPTNSAWSGSASAITGTTIAAPDLVTTTW